jgi:hypothetical protein
MTLTLLSAVYAIAPGVTNTYQVEVNFEGWVPIFGGKEGKASAKFTVTAMGLENVEGKPAVESEITEMEAMAFGSKLPLNKNNVSQFFPKSQVTYSPSGRVLSNSAPEIRMPVKLPGLDSQRLPEISYLPLELPEGTPTVGMTYSFQRKFGGVPVEYKVLVDQVNDKEIFFKLTLSQNAKSFEDAYGNPVEEVDAKKKLDVQLTGTGTAVFNRSLSRFDYVIVDSNTTTKVTPIAKGKETTRNLKMIMKITRDNMKVDQR